MKKIKLNLIMKILIALILIIVVANIVKPKEVNAGFWDYLGGTAKDLIDSILQFLLYFMDLLIETLQASMIGTTKDSKVKLPVAAIEKSNIFFSPYIIFSNQVAGLQIDFFNPGATKQYKVLYDTGIVQKNGEEYEDYINRVCVANSEYAEGYYNFFEEPDIETVANLGLALAYDQMDWKTNPEVGYGLVGEYDFFDGGYPSFWGERTTRADKIVNANDFDEFIEVARNYIYGEIIADFYYKYYECIFEAQRAVITYDGEGAPSVAEKFFDNYPYALRRVLNCFRIQQDDDGVFFMEDVFGATYVEFESNANDAKFNTFKEELAETFEDLGNFFATSITDRPYQEKYTTYRFYDFEYDPDLYTTYEDFFFEEIKEVFDSTSYRPSWKFVFEIYNKPKSKELSDKDLLFEHCSTTDEKLAEFHHFMCFFIWDVDYLNFLKNVNYPDKTEWNIFTYSWDDIMEVDESGDTANFSGNDFNILAESILGTDSFENIKGMFNGYLNNFNFTSEKSTNETDADGIDR